MKENHIYRISVILSILGILTIYASSAVIGPEEVNIGEIERENSGEIIAITGEITDYYRSDSHLFLDVSDGTGEISVSDFDSEARVKEGDTIRVEGEISLYEGDLQIIAREVKKAHGRKQ